jgi:hypothetical protein
LGASVAGAWLSRLSIAIFTIAILTHVDRFQW